MRASFASLLIFFVACGRGAEAPRKRPPPLVAVAKVAPKDVQVEVRAPVDLRPFQQADIGSKTLGYLDAVLVDRGDRVRRGQVLALVRPSDLPDQLAVLRGSLAQSQANLALARSSAERTRALAPSGVVSRQEVDQTASALEAATAQERAVQSQIAALGVRLGETRITSPLDGVVWQRRLDPGVLVGQPSGGIILSVVQIDQLRVFVDVSERQAMGLKVGQVAFLELDALPGQRIEGKLVRLSPAFDPATRTLEAEVRIANPDGKLRPGMYGRCAIILDTHKGAATVTAAAVQTTAGKRYVFQLVGDKAKRVEVETGVDGGDWLEIVKGVTIGDDVLIAGADGLADGATVRAARGVDPFSGEKK